MEFVRIGLFSFLIFNLIYCSKPQEETLFTLLPSNQTGIDFRNDLTSTGEMNILEYLYFYNGGGVAVGDINNDGLPDIFTTDMLPEDPVIWMKSLGEDKQEVYDIKQKLGYGDQYVRNHLQLNRGDGRFSEIGLLTETFATDWSWSPLIFDMDNDGKKDIHVTNGIVKRPNDLDFVQYSQEPTPGLTDKEKENQQIEMLPTVKLSNFTFKNEGGLKFTNASKLWGLDQLSYSNGSAYADLDNDGDLDLVVNNTDQEAFVYRNNASEMTTNRFVQIDLRSEDENTFGIGAQVWVFSEGETYFQTLSTSRGFQSGSSTTLTFGLGNSEKIDSVLISWNSKENEVYQNPNLDQRHLIKKGNGEEASFPFHKTNSVLEIADIILDWKHEEKSIIDEFRREYLMPRRYGIEGPALAVGDLNGDGLDDIFLGGANGQPSALFFQDVNGGFSKVENPFFEQLKTAEDVVAVIEDFNQDGHLDLYVGSGGNEYGRAESLVRKYDFIVSRAVTRFANFLPWVKGKFKKEDFNEFPNGIFLLKGGDIDEEMEEREVSYVTYHLDDYFTEEFFETKKIVFVPWEGKR